MAPYQWTGLVSGPLCVGRLGFVLGDTGVDDAADIVFLVFDFAQQIVVFLVLVVLDFDILDDVGFVGFHHRHARFRLGFFFLDFLVFVLAGRRHVQRRLDHGRDFFLFFFGLGLIVLFLFLVFCRISGVARGDRAGIGGGLGDAAAALLEQRFGLIAETALGALDPPLREAVKPRGAAGPCPFGSKICLDQTDR